VAYERGPPPGTVGRKSPPPLLFFLPHSLYYIHVGSFTCDCFLPGPVPMEVAREWNRIRLQEQQKWANIVSKQED
jgi:hypothetical protein